MKKIPPALVKTDQLPNISLLNNWEDFQRPIVTRAERIAKGNQLRKDCPRHTHGFWQPKKDRALLQMLASQDESRLSHLIPLRYWRMSQSPFAFYRGGALIMAGDLAEAGRSNLIVQLCGDCHLSNFGIFATPERNVIFDLNDFDETLPGPFEWDLKRLAASFVVCADSNGFKQSVGASCVEALVRIYKRKMEEYSQMHSLDVWYERVDWEYLVDRIKKPGRKLTALGNLEKLKAKRSHAGAVSKLTEIVDGKRRIKDEPPVVYHAENATQDAMKQVLQMYLKSLWQSRQRLVQRYSLVDVAAKVVGVGSVGTAAGIILLQGEGGEEDFIFLQVKQATRSVLEKYIGRSEFEHSGQRIVSGQRLLQSASDMFLGWTTGPKREFYIRQLMDVKVSVPVDELDAVSLEQYAEVCGFVLARAHARSGDPAQIHGYLGGSNSTTFDEALVQFACDYAQQNQRDFEHLTDAIQKGKIQARAEL